MKNKIGRILIYEAVMAVGLMAFFTAINFIPARRSESMTSNGDTVFLKAADYQEYVSEYQTDGQNLNRIEVLFKNPNLESRDEVRAEVINQAGKTIVAENLNGYNLGDTTQARINLPKGSLNSDKYFQVRIMAVKTADGKLQFGTKDNRIEIIRYYDTGKDFKTALNDGFKIFSRIIFLQPGVVLIPAVLLAIWLW